MSVNLKDEGVKAVRALSAHPAWGAFRDAIFDNAQFRANQALDAPVELQAGNIGYARCLRDLFIAIEAAATNTPHQKVVKPGAAINSTKV